jgi:hypothetical protein
MPGAPQGSQRTVVPVPRSEPAVGSFYDRSWAVVIGIDDYQHPRIPKLGFAVNDARAVQSTLLEQGFRQDHIFALLNGDATKRRIEGILGDDLRQRVGPNDRVLVFFAGHGKTDKLRSGEDEGYLIPVDGDPARLFANAISMTSLRQISERLPAKHILFIVDACYSGYAIFNRAISDALLDEMVRKPAIQILTAGRKEDTAQERSGHGVFTQVLLQGLRGEAFTGKSWVALEELGVWMRPRVYAESNRRQLPQYGTLSGEGQFVFVKPGTAVAVAPSPPPPLGRPLPPPPVSGPPLPVLKVESDPPGAEVSLGSLAIGKTPLALGTFEPGRHRLVLALDGHATVEEHIEIVQGKSVAIARTLDRQSGGLEIVTTPSGLRVAIDGEPVGASPHRAERLRVGRHGILISDGQHQIRREIVVEQDKVTRVEVEFATRPGQVVILSAPSGADVYEGQRRLGVTPWSGELGRGHHQIRVVKDGYEERVFNLLMAPTEWRTLDAPLVRKGGLPGDTPTQGR